MIGRLAITCDYSTCHTQDSHATRLELDFREEAQSAVGRRTGVVIEHGGINVAGNRTASENFLRHGVGTRDRPKFGHSRVGIVVNLDAHASVGCEGRASPADVLSLAVPRCVSDIGAEPLSALR